ncbi:MAG: inorganic phosphate transporter [Mucinivorans sp.]
MDSIYIVILTILMALAVSDLVVGVSNDAVNFLNSAIGSKAAPRYVIMLVASAGILLGSIFSSGMMEVARSGVFIPSEFNFHDVMLLFLAVMFTDVILLDMFNTFGLPTSTTVSLIFELLGAAVAVSVVNMWNSETVTHLSQYINAGNAFGIISGILSSVVIAFTTGITVMFISRLIFSFHYKKSFRYIGALWCGMALTAITYFAVFKGLKDTTLMAQGVKDFMEQNTFMLVVGSFFSWTILMAFVQWAFKFNILKITVLAGTLSLALAFAGNDLVNFIGVSMAGLSSYEIASDAMAQGVDLETLKMGALAGEVKVHAGYLLLAGLIMIVTLWTSKKARSVTETEINLARQEGVERFGSTSLSRSMVRSALTFNKRYQAIVPARIRNYIDKRFEPLQEEQSDENRAPFDLIRATVNLSAASILISLATSFRLPLSTTYVTFMVAMGSSLADRAWGRESAVYRITGVLTVITGWFLTAFIAFSVAFIVAMILMYGQQWAIYGLAIVCAFILVQSKLLYLRRRKKIEAKESPLENDNRTVTERSRDEICQAMQQMTTIYNQTLTGLFDEDRKLLKHMVREADGMYAEAHERKHQILPILNQLEASNVDTGHYFVQVADYLNEVAKALVHITRPSYEHINNNHEGLSREQIADLRNINDHVKAIYERINHMLQTGNFDDLDSTLQQRDMLFDVLAEAIKHQVRRVIDNDSSARSSLLYLEIINETKTMVLQSRNLLKSQKHFIND